MSADSIESDQASEIREICRGLGNDRTRLMDILRQVQRRFRCIDAGAMRLIADAVGCHRVEVEGLVSFYAFFSESPKGRTTIRLCDDIVDRHQGVLEIAEQFCRELGIGIGETSADGAFSLEFTPCIGMSDQAPAALINDRVVTSLSRESARRIIEQLKSGVAAERLELPVGEGNNNSPLVNVPVRNNIRVTGPVLLAPPTEQAGLKRALETTPEAVLAELESSGLGGRGGAGFPAGRKWRLAAETPAERRFVFCNADEGEPGTFKDRVLLTERFDQMVEGMAIAAHAIGAREGLIYLRGEYSYLHPFLEARLADLRARGLLGRAIMGREGFDFDIRIQLGAGAYVCGEESALISSCEGRRGEPKTRPPFPVQSGYLGYPTLVNNVETFCCAARILQRGAQWFRGFGSECSPGTKLFSVSGDCSRPGVYELPQGVTVRELLERAGGESAAAVQVSGPSGELINMTQFDRRLCAEDLPCGGAITVFAPHRNIIEIFDYYMGFFVEESCGYCTPCRVGNVFLKMRIGKIRQGLAQPEDLDYLRELGQTVRMTSRCGFGHTSPNPVLSSIRNFPLVYAALLKPGKERLRASFDIQAALEESRRIAKRRSMIYDPTYDGE